MTLTLTKSYRYLLPILFAFACLSLLSSVFFQVHEGKPTDLIHIFDISFYHFVPVILWVGYLPFLYKLSLRLPLSRNNWKKHILKHVLISIAFAPLSRLLAITIDFWLKKQIGMIDVPVLSVVLEVKWVIVASMPNELFIYWAVLLLLAYFQNLSKSTIGKQSKSLVVESSEGSSIIPLQDILWIEAAKNYIMIHTTTGEVRSRRTIKALLNDLDQKFIQVHRSHIVNKEAVSKLKHWRNGEYLITMRDGRHVSSTRTFLDNVRSMTA